MRNKRDGFAIALAWPETFCKQSSALYDPIMNFLKITRNNHYQVGHSAVVLVDQDGKCFYYDFGRYHAPFGFGRVRSEFTDSELKINSKIEIQNGKILNFKKVIAELSQKKECHGAGKLQSSYTQINFEKAKSKADEMQVKSPLKYGPFIYDGTNCSRFVRNVISAGKPTFYRQIKLWTQYTITASPALNVAALSNIEIQNSLEEKLKIPEKKDLKSVLAAPELKPHHAAKWFSGEGAGSWFVIQPKEENQFLVQKFSPDLKIESATEMILDSEFIFDLKGVFNLKFPCNSREITLQQNETQLVLRKVV